MITIHEHTFEDTILPDTADILDLGCRGFLFAEFLKHIGHNVVCVDADTLKGDYIQCAISNYNGYADLKRRPHDPQATSIIKTDIKMADSIPCFTLDKFSKMVNIDFWDLIKIDIEGSEREVILSLTKAPAKQLSIEFHLHTRIYEEPEVIKMVERLTTLGYEVVQHKKTSQYGAGLNYWDSLFILK